MFGVPVILDQPELADTIELLSILSEGQIVNLVAVVDFTVHLVVFLDFREDPQIVFPLFGIDPVVIPLNSVTVFAPGEGVHIEGSPASLTART